MTERLTSEIAAGYRTDMAVRRLARSTSAMRRIREQDHVAPPAAIPPPPESPPNRPARKTAPRRPAVRRTVEELEPLVDTENLLGEAVLIREHPSRPPAGELPIDDPQAPEPDEDLEPEPSEPEAELPTPALRNVGDLPPTMSIVEAGVWLGIGRTLAYQLARDGAFPVRSIRVGNQRRVITAELLTTLGIPLAW
jgi:hypothetical protein